MRRRSVSRLLPFLVRDADASSNVSLAVFELNGEVRAVLIEDRDAAIEKVSRERASSEPGSVGAPMAGVVIEVRVKEGQEIKAGDPLLVLSAMKMESVVSSPVSGHVARVVVNPSDSIGQGDRAYSVLVHLYRTQPNADTLHLASSVVVEIKH